MNQLWQLLSCECNIRGKRVSRLRSVKGFSFRHSGKINLVTGGEKKHIWCVYSLCCVSLIPADLAGQGCSPHPSWKADSVVLTEAHRLADVVCDCQTHQTITVFFKQYKVEKQLLKPEAHTSAHTYTRIQINISSRVQRVRLETVTEVECTVGRQCMEKANWHQGLIKRTCSLAGTRCGSLGCPVDWSV